MVESRTLARSYRRAGEGEAARTSPLDARVAIALAESDEAMRAIAAAPAHGRRPSAVLAALQDLALAGRAPALASAHADRDGDAAAVAAVALLVTTPDLVMATAARRPVRADETGRCAVLHPAIAEAAARVGASTIGMVDLDGGAGLNLTVDRAAVRHGDGGMLGDPSSVRHTAEVVGDRSVPWRVLPEVVTRILVDRDPFDVTDPDDTRWLRACVPPDHPERRARLDDELALAASAPPTVVRGDAVDVLSEVVADMPLDALPVVVTTWSLARRSREERLRMMEHLDASATDRPVAWITVEGVGVAPAVPTLGDRRGSGHSIVGLTIVEAQTLRSEAIGRCWSRGRWMSWLADTRGDRTAVSPAPAPRPASR
ncbi:DUF2332 domain-containing protein [Salsipaludibacter albus]|uniref:DUF2332 domain-containing protein n=1 Tax=Salsipaludibacter albus TaxID=2849650 RepID=UPI001EE49532